MKRLFALLLALVLILGMAACTGESGESPRNTGNPEQSTGVSNTPENTPAPTADPAEDDAAFYGGTMVFAATPGDTYDPMFTSGWKSYYWSMNVYENIINRDAEGNLCPGVCDFDLSEDNLTLKLRVRDGVTFHNGRPVTIEDVKASFDRACVKVSRTKNHVAKYLESAEIENGNTLVLKFNAYDVTTMYYLSANQTWNVVLPKEICEKYGTDNAITDVADAIGTGPYVVDPSSEPGVKITLNRYDGYVPVEEGHTGMGAPKKAYLDTIIVQKFGDSTVQMMSLMDGSLNFALYNNDWASVLGSYDNLIILPDRDTNANYICFNCMNPDRPVADANIRKAIAAAMDYSELMNYQYPLGFNPSSSPIAEGLYYAEAYAAAPYHGDANIELAKQYLREAGYNGEEIVYVTDSSDSLGPILETQFTKAGINLKVEYMDSGSIDEYIQTHSNAYDFTVQRSALCDYIPTTLATNFMVDHWDNAEKTNLLEKLGTLVYGSDESIAAWKQLDQLLAEECPSICIGSGGSYYVADNLNWNCQGVWRYWWNAYYYPAE